MSVSVETTRNRALQLENGDDWRTVNYLAGGWGEGAKDDPEEDAYAHRYMFHRQASYKDARVTFEFSLASHSEVGIILRATDESHFYVLHFPSCGQACRAQHFWVALSKMDDSGYLKHIKLEMVRRVPSNPEIWLDADVTLKGNKIAVRVGNGYFEAEDDTYTEAGRIGVFLAYTAQIRNLVVEGEEVASDWDSGVERRANWFFPCPDRQCGPAQQPIDLLKLPSRELLLTFKASESVYKAGPLFMTRSKDAGRTWSAPEPVAIPSPEGAWFHLRLHVTPAGRLICLVPTEEGLMLAESTDEGRAWSQPVPMDLGPLPDKLQSLHVGPQAFVNLADGSMLLLRYGKHTLQDPDLSVWNWGSLHTTAFSSRSTDDGRTWSAPVGLDNSAGLGSAGMCGNLDLTEVCAAEMGDGRLMALIRPIFSPWMWETWSTDGGNSWGPCVRGPFPGYATPNMLCTSSGKVLVSHRLPSMTVNCSQDNGRSWDEGAQIDSPLWVMGSMAEVEPDVVLYVYWGVERMRAQFLRITPDGLVPAYPDLGE